MNVLEGRLASVGMVNVRPDGSDHLKAEDSTVTSTPEPRWIDHRWDDGLTAFTSEPQGRSGLHRRMTANRQPLGSEVVLANGRNRRNLVVAARSGEGPFTHPLQTSSIAQGEAAAR